MASDPSPAEVVADAVHEINNPLCALLGMLEFLVADVEPGTRSAERLELVQASALEIRDIVARLRVESRSWGVE